MAKNIAMYLEAHGYKVFFDYDSLENGMFDNQIYKAIEDSNDFILVLTENALNHCVNEDDWVRNEILHAKKHGKNIILATDSERFKSYPDNLPLQLQFLKSIDWTPIHPKLFEESMKMLTKRLKSHSKKLKVLYYSLFLISLISIALALYLYIPAKMMTYNLDDDEDYPIELFANYDTIEDVDDFDDILPDEIEALFACRASKDRKDRILITVEDLEEIDPERYGFSDEQLDEFIKMMTDKPIQHYYEQMKKSLAISQLREDFTPIIHKSGNFEWIISRCYDSSINKETWRMSSKIGGVLFLNIIITGNKTNWLAEKRFVINLKRLLNRSDVVLMKFVEDELY